MFKKINENLDKIEIKIKEFKKLASIKIYLSHFISKN